MGKFLIDEKDIKQLTNIKGGCIASNRITVDGAKVGYMYREVPCDQYADSGWRFFAGDESDEYCENPDNFNIFELNTICNYDPSIIPHLDAKIDTSFEKTKGDFVEIKEY